MLRTNTRKPKKFWKLIKGLIDNDDSADITLFVFKYTHRDEIVTRGETPDFLNEFVVNIAETTRVTNANIDHEYDACYDNIDSNFDFMPPSLDEIYGYMIDIDVNMSSCIEGVNAKMCKVTLDSIPETFVHLFANSLFQGIFPISWTLSYVTLLPKNGEKTLPNNWRPISQTIVYAKILEKIVHHQLLKYFSDNAIFSQYQFGFLPEKSTQEAVFNTIRHIYSSINQNKIMGMLFLVMAKAFNCINHNTLYKKLSDVGMCERVIDWFKSYLNRSQIIRYGDTMSNIMNIPAGIAQGTVLGPLIFIFYINDCFKILKNAHITMFADDCVLYLSGNNWNNIYEKLQNDLHRFVNWSKKNSLALNGNKSQAMIVCTRKKLAKIENLIPFKINNINMKYVKQYNYLGVPWCTVLIS